MGTNKRYPHVYDKLMDQRILERIAREDGPLQSLTREELELDTEPVTRDPKPRAVKAWVRFGTTPVRVDAVVLEWTSQAVKIRFEVGGKTLETALWASAVRETRPRTQS
ncbi:hypothetical protein DEA06_14485 [Microbacterium sp. Gd 4-13]|uniref:hypothetical protein n=1 Tax=Microbacterium sp. Gd 4-13 TaxID=2173179 RepID=UPI000D56D21E|nr:hypothetical protein [Microbacterium sp. Gd 4-13]PVW02977.1 hypothetical protein DEA06_14485 [Microbacterium sp. Gd 4-13]